jgi:integrase
MSNLKLRFVNSHVDHEYGTVYHYFRRGHMRVRLPGQPGSAEFMAAYAAALEQSSKTPLGVSRSKPGSITHCVAMYFSSAQFAELASSTKSQRRSILERFRADHGAQPLSSVPPKFIQAMLAKMPGHPARNWFKAIRSLCQFAVDHGMIEVDPTQAVRRPKAKSERRRAWTDAEVAQFEATHPIGSTARLGFALGLYSVQRLGDVIGMGPQHIHKGRLEIRQHKTGTAVSVPVRPELQAIIDATPSGHLTFLTKTTGRPFGASEFSQQFRAWSNEAGLPKDCVFHGLRSTGCTRLAEAGCTPHEIAAWSGHKSLGEVEGYTRSANQKKLADQALARAAQA